MTDWKKRVSDPQIQIAILEKDLEDAQKEVKDLRSENQKLRTEIDAWRERLRDLTKQYAKTFDNF